MVNTVSLNDNVRMSFCNTGYSEKNKSDESIFLDEKLKEISDKQGILGQAWNGLKELTTLGVSESDCENMIDKYNNGEISFDEAVNYLNEYDSKQKTMSGLLSNIATGAGSIAAATITAGGSTIAWGSAAFLKGGLIGGVLKPIINIFDRATNEVENDALNAKLVAKDAISGTITGMTSAVSSGVGKGFATLTSKGNLGTTVFNGTTCGIACGSLSGSTSYLTDVAFGDREFDMGELIDTTLTSASVSGIVGAGVGAGLYGLNNLKIDKAITSSTTIPPTSVNDVIVKDIASSSARKIAGSETKEILELT